MVTRVTGEVSQPRITDPPDLRKRQTVAPIGNLYSAGICRLLPSRAQVPHKKVLICEKGGQYFCIRGQVFTESGLYAACGPFDAAAC